MYKMECIQVLLYDCHSHINYQILCPKTQVALLSDLLSWKLFLKSSPQPLAPERDVEMSLSIRVGCAFDKFSFSMHTFRTYRKKYFCVICQSHFRRFLSTILFNARFELIDASGIVAKYHIFNISTGITPFSKTSSLNLRILCIFRIQEITYRNINMYMYLYYFYIY